MKKQNKGWDSINADSALINSLKNAENPVPAFAGAGLLITLTKS